MWLLNNDEIKIDHEFDRFIKNTPDSAQAMLSGF